jgi:cysteinyl-tRNA synthetase
MDVKYVMNLTDVGHLTGDNLGDADLGEDRMEKAAKKEGKTAWEVAEFYTDVFLQDFKKLHLKQPELFAKATDHIKEQIALVERLEKRGFTYQTSDGIYFDTAKFPSYGELSNLDERKAGARVEINPEKKNQKDFALWKFSHPIGALRQGQGGVGTQRQMEWGSPWGVGFPGWHIECSAMSMKYLGESFDIHTGGIDLRETHHPNEIAQAEAATGKRFVNYWVHGAFILVNGERMSKSKGNLYTVYDLEKQGYDCLALKYLYLQTHYRQEMNFTFSALDGAQIALGKLRSEVAKLTNYELGITNYGDKEGKGLEEKFLEAINDDLNMPRALGVVWELVKSDIPKDVKARILFKMDGVLGLDLERGSSVVAEEKQIVPDEVRQLVKERNALRKARKFNMADQVRKRIGELGYEIEDSGNGTKVRKKVSIV